MQASVERIRSSKNKFLEQQTLDGKVQGRDWAQGRAEYWELIQVAKIDMEYLYDYRESADKTLKSIYMFIDPKNTSDYDDFIDRAFGNNVPNSIEFCLGWVVGAQFAFYEIVDQL